MRIRIVSRVCLYVIVVNPSFKSVGQSVVTISADLRSSLKFLPSGYLNPTLSYRLSLNAVFKLFALFAMLC